MKCVLYYFEMRFILFRSYIGYVPDLTGKSVQLFYQISCELSVLFVGFEGIGPVEPCMPANLLEIPEGQLHKLLVSRVVKAPWTVSFCLSFRLIVWTTSLFILVTLNYIQQSYYLLWNKRASSSAWKYFSNMDHLDVKIKKNGVHGYAYWNILPTKWLTKTAYTAFKHHTKLRKSLCVKLISNCP